MTAAASAWAASASTTALTRAGLSRAYFVITSLRYISYIRCSDCPVLDDIDEEITDEEMEMLVNMDYDDFENNKLEE